PAAPVAVAAVAGAGEATLTWAAPPDDGGSPVTGYLVTPVRDGTAETPRSVLGPAATTAVTGLRNGSVYRFTVAAVNIAGTGAPSAPSESVTPRAAPAAPVAVTAAVRDGRAIVSWVAPPDDGGSPITGYVVTPFRDDEPQAATAFPSAATTQTVSGLDPNGSYTFTVAAVNALGTGPASARSAPLSGYWMLGADGRVYPFGDMPHLGDPVGHLGGVDAVDLEPVPTLDGYWIVDAGGRVYSYGAAPYLGAVDPARLHAGERVTSLSGTRTGAGYWMFTTEGRVFAFGDAEHFGDMGGTRLNAPVLDSIATPSGRGYYMVAGDGGIFTFGDAAFAGSMGGQRLNAPVESMVPDGDGRGYWLVASDGGVFAFDALFRGSMGAVPLNRPITGMVRFGNGYLMAAEDGGIFNFSDWAFRGSLGSDAPARSIVSIAAAG
ncbi:MAG TPA: fibronectin type III domain-containing protein, partial [Acidimicrobiia bacterium]|nr:fibronectin type III domain-containing protein [Acidimicrobiia bacterium]